MASKQISISSFDLICMLRGYAAMLVQSCDAHVAGMPFPPAVQIKDVTDRMDAIVAELSLQSADPGNKKAA